MSYSFYLTKVRSRQIRNKEGFLPKVRDSPARAVIDQSSPQGLYHLLNPLWFVCLSFHGLPAKRRELFPYLKQQAAWKEYTFVGKSLLFCFHNG